MKALEACLKDIPDLCKLLDYLFEQEEEFKPDVMRQSKGLEKILKNGNIGTILVLKDKEKTVGMVCLLYTISTALGGTVALLEDMVIAPEFRGKGFGSSLLVAATEYAKNRGCKRITLLTDSSNSSAQKFYIRHGFSKSPMLPMRLALNA